MAPEKPPQQGTGILFLFHITAVLLAQFGDKKPKTIKAMTAIMMTLPTMYVLRINLQFYDIFH